MKLKLENKFLIPVIALIVAGMSVSIFISFAMSHNAIKDLSRDQLLKVADSGVKHLASWIKIIKMDMARLSDQSYFTIAVRDTFIGRTSRKTVDIYLKNAKKAHECYKSLNLADINGKIVSSSSQNNNKVIKDRLFFRESIKGETFLSDAYPDRVSSTPVFVVSVPVKSNDEVTGVLFAIVDIGYFSREYIDKTKVGQKGHAFLISRAKTAISNTGRSVNFKPENKEFLNCLESKIWQDGVFSCTVENNEKFIALALEHETGWRIAVSVDHSDILKPVHQLGFINFAIAGSMIVFLAITIRFIVKTITSPISKLKKGVITIGKGNLDYRINVETQDEIGELTRAFNEMADRRKQAEELLFASLAEKEILFKELHHRVKNNLEVISGLHYLQSASIDDARTKELFMESEKRVKSIGMIHEKLYKYRNLTGVDFADYLDDLTDNLMQAYAARTGPVHIDIKAGNIFFELETAVPCGLIIVELVSNAMKYAFPRNFMSAGKAPEIHIALTRSHQDNYTLIVSDNGIGFPDDIDYQNTESLGMQLVNMLASQLEGGTSMTTGQGTTFKINFTKIMYKKRL
ncbi:histidine kinase dimerization/phosphoacceptor domain -containing protein [Desulfobacterales bacterium HSG17]|nr:histidine kinase dimerization/phosphoacceptor domain -containing protein [Desulfobacterales bacterium HSG17]